jgi:hypothetical protein
MKNRPFISIVVVNQYGDRSTAKIKGDGVTQAMIYAAHAAINALSGNGIPRPPKMKHGKGKTT